MQLNYIYLPAVRHYHCFYFMRIEVSNLILGATTKRNILFSYSTLFTHNLDSFREIYNFEF